MENKEIRHIEPQSSKDRYLYCKEVVNYMRKNHLDIGCGQGNNTVYISSLRTQSNVTGFDIDQLSINVAKQKTNPYSIVFTSSFEELSSKNFDSASAIFTFHENPVDVFKTASSFLKSGAYFSVVDYDIKNIGIYKFQDIFNTTGELNEVAEIGWKEACIRHTSLSSSDCQKIAENNGFKTIETKKINEKYFFWAGQKI